MNAAIPVLLAWIWGLVLAVLASVNTVGAAKADSPPAADAEVASRGATERELTRMQHAWAAAIASGDRKVLEGILDEEFVATDSTGHLWGRADSLDAIASGLPGVTSMEVDDIKVRVYGEAAVVTGRSHARTKPARADYQGSYRITNTYVRRPGGWRCVAAQEGRIVE